MAEHQIARPQPSPCPECGAERLVAQSLNNLRLVAADARLPGFTTRFTEL